jgi:hypothetical protein
MRPPTSRRCQEPGSTGAGGVWRWAYGLLLVGGLVGTSPPLAHSQELPTAAATAPAPAFSVPSTDGQWLAQAFQSPPSVWVLDAQRRVVQRWAIASLRHEPATGVLGLWAVPERRSWVLAPAGLAELWEISHDPAAEPVLDGWVHDYRMAEYIAKPGFLGVRRTPLEQPMQIMGLGGGSRVWLAPVVAAGQAPPLTWEVWHLAVRRRTGTMAAQTSPAAPVAPE